MSLFILEILSEEVPSLAHKKARESLQNVSLEVLTKNEISVSKEQILIKTTPRRLILEIKDLPEIQKIEEVIKIGPNINANEIAIQGFLKSLNLSSVNELEIIKNKNSQYYSYKKTAFELETYKILEKSIPEILAKLINSWPKLVRWNINNEEYKWVRPVRNILCLFNKRTINFNFFGLSSNNYTYPHFLYSNQKILINDAKNFENILKENYVILDHKERKNIIKNEIHKLENELDIRVIENIDDENNYLLEEVVGLCEWPKLLHGKIDESYMDLPTSLLILTLKSNQKYFCTSNKLGELSNIFLYVNNSFSNTNYNNITKDNEKVVKARLQDAKFFIEEDFKTPFIDRLERLKHIVFHNKIGSVYDKVIRVNSLAKFLSVFVPHSDITLVETVSDLLKNDLTTKLVQEFPELQGIIGGYYAMKLDYKEQVIFAIKEHYLPTGPNSDIPQSPLGIVFSIADKIDTIISLFLVGEKPTSSKDPNGLRRLAIGIIRISYEKNIALPIKILFEKSLVNFQSKLINENLSQENKTNLYSSRKELVLDIVKFFVERLKFYLKENQNIDPKILNYIIDDYINNIEEHPTCDILYLAKKIEFVDRFTKDKNNEYYISLCKRVSNILSIEEKKDDTKYDKKILLFKKNNFEANLIDKVNSIKKEYIKYATRGEFDKATDLLKEVSIPLEEFFNNVMINDDDKKTRENRLSILSNIRSLFEEIVDFSKI